MPRQVPLVFTTPGQLLHFSGAIGSPPVNVLRSRRARDEGYTASVRGPSRILASFESQTGHGIPLPVQDPHIRLLPIVDLHGETAAIGREMDLQIVSRSGSQSL